MDSGTVAPASREYAPGTALDWGDPTEHSLSDARSEGPVVVNFYLSTDRTFSHRAFAGAENIGVRLLSDSDGAVSESYDALYEEFEGHKRIVKRSVYAIDTEGAVRYV